MANTAKSSRRGFIAFEAEDSFADSADDTYTTVIQTRDDAIDFSGLQRPLVERGGVFQRLGEGDWAVPGAYGLGTVRFTVDAGGHGSTCAGSLTEPDLAKLLGHVFGNSDWTQAGNTSGVTAAGSDADTIAGTVGTHLLGGLMRVGDLGDGNAGGQGTVIGDSTNDNTTPLELDVALPGTVANDDNLYAAGMIYPATGSGENLTSDGSTTNNTLRFVFATANQVIACRGGACTSVSLTGLNPGELPRWEFEFSFAQWEPITSTFPTSSATSTVYPAPVANGSLFDGQVGATTRVTPSHVREFSIDFNHAVTPLFGPGGENTAQNVVGWVRTRPNPWAATISYAVEAEAQTATPTYWVRHGAAPGTAASLRHLLWTTNTVDGRSLLLYAPYCVPMDAVPVQGDIDGLNYVRLSYKCLTVPSPSTSNELTRSGWRLGMC